VLKIILCLVFRKKNVEKFQRKFKISRYFLAIFCVLFTSALSSHPPKINEQEKYANESRAAVIMKIDLIFYAYLSAF
jgi:hypothetical protein